MYFRRQIPTIQLLLFMFFAGTGFSQLMWERNYGGEAGEWGYSVQQTTDGGYIIAGVIGSFGNNTQVYLIKTDSLGDSLWARVYGGTGNEYGRCIQQTQDGGYIIAGYTTSFGNGVQIYLIKTDSLGDTLWTRTYGGEAGEWGYSVQQTTDGGYIIAGVTGSFGNNTQVYLIKTDSLGDSLWARVYGGTGNEYGRCIQQTTDGGYIVAGFTWRDILLIKIDSLGDTLWTRTYGGTPLAFGYSVQQTQDRGYIVAGYSLYPDHYSQFYLVKTDSLGGTLWTRYYGGTGYDMGRSVQQTQDGGYIIAGRTYSFGNDDQIYLIKTDAEGNSGIEESSFVRYLPYTSHPPVYPNPFSSFTTVIGYEKERFILYDIMGRQVGSYFGNRIGFGLQPGVYFIKPIDQNLKPIRAVKGR